MQSLTMTAGELIDAAPTLALLGTPEHKPKSERTKYALGTAKRNAAPHLEELEARRLSLLSTHSEKDEKGEPKIENNAFVLADRHAFAAEFNDLRKEEVTLVGVRPVTLEELEGTELSVDQLMALGPFVVEPEDSTAPGTLPGK